MKRNIQLSIAAALAASLGAGTAMAEPGGCIKYGAVGGVGGHVVHHGVAGAVGGCAVGMYKRHEYRKQQREMAREQQRQATPYGDESR